MDKNGRLPLHLILVSNDKTLQQYKMLKRQQHDFDSECGFTLNIEQSVDELLHAYPSAIEARDPLTGLLPFMLAASIRSMPLDVIYKLLIRNPTLVNFSNTITTLKRKRNHVLDLTSSSKKMILDYCQIDMTLVNGF